MYMELSAYIEQYREQLQDARRASVLEEIAGAIEHVRRKSHNDIVVVDSWPESIVAMICDRCGWQAESFDRESCWECGSPVRRAAMRRR